MDLDLPCYERADDCVCERRGLHKIHACQCGGQWQLEMAFHVIAWPGSNPDWNGRHPDRDRDGEYA